MAAIRRKRKFSIPVLSRLTLAWLGAFSLLVLFSGAALYATLSGEGPGRVSLPIEQLETFARVETPAPEPVTADPSVAPSVSGLRLSPPDLRESQYAAAQAEEAAASETEDLLAYPEAFPVEEKAPGEIIITIDGNAPATSISAASLTRVTARKVADPDPELLRRTSFGRAPRIAPDGRKAMHVYTSETRDHKGAPQIAIIVGGLGLNKALTERAIDDLPPEVSLAFAPYAKDLKFWTDKARAAGHEVLIELPMEGYGGNPDALGAAGLLTTRSREENLQRLDWLMSRFEGYFAATNYLGAKFSAQEEALAPILEKLSASGVAYIDDTGAARATKDVRRNVIATVNRIVPAAPDDSQRNAVRRELRALEKIAERDGAALGKTYAYAATLDEIDDWFDRLESRGLAPAPASAVLNKNAAR